MDSLGKIAEELQGVSNHPCSKFLAPGIQLEDGETEISAANRKMLKAASGKGKKESSVECESERGSSVDPGLRRESESVIHGALQIAGAVPGLVTEQQLDSDGERPGSGGGREYSRQNSRGSLSLPGHPGQGRRGSSGGPCLR